MIDTKKTKKDVIYILRVFTPKNGKVKYYQKRAFELSKTVNKNPPWSWRYVQSVDRGTVKPSMKFIKATKLLIDKQNEPPMPIWRRRVRKGIAQLAKRTRQDLGLQK